MMNISHKDTTAILDSIYEEFYGIPNSYIDVYKGYIDRQFKDIFTYCFFHNIDRERIDIKYLLDSYRQLSDTGYIADTY